MILPCEIPQLDIPDVGRNHIHTIIFSRSSPSNHFSTRDLFRQLVWKTMSHLAVMYLEHKIFVSCNSPIPMSLIWCNIHLLHCPGIPAVDVAVDGDDRHFLALAVVAKGSDLIIINIPNYWWTIQGWTQNKPKGVEIRGHILYKVDFFVWLGGPTRTKAHPFVRPWIYAMIQAITSITVRSGTRAIL